DHQLGQPPPGVEREEPRSRESPEQWVNLAPDKTPRPGCDSQTVHSSQTWSLADNLKRLRERPSTPLWRRHEHRQGARSGFDSGMRASQVKSRQLGKDPLRFFAA